MLITITGSDDNFIRNALTTTTEDLNPVSNSSTEIVMFNPESGLTSTISGVNLVLDSNGDAVSGTVTGISVTSGAVPLGALSNLSWPLVDIADALDALEVGNNAPMAALFNLGPTLTVDASGATSGVDMFNLFGFDLATMLTVPMTVTGSSFYDRLLGGSGSDSITPGADNGNFEGGDIEGTLGNDTIDFSGVNSTTFQFLDYEDLIDGPLTFNINASTNISSISGAGFSDTLIDVRRVMEADGLGLEGGEDNDVFNVTNSDNSWFNLRGNEGNDTFNINIANGGGRISYDFGSQDAPASGITVNLATGIVSNDGFGGQDTINILSGDGRLEIRATDNNDSIMGSDRNESFITEQGNDTVNGGGGFDRVRYDRSGVDAVNVNLATQTATGTWDGNAFTDTLISIEHVRGSRQGNDTLIGAAADELFEGRGGNDSILGNTGNDRLEGGDGNDTLRGGGGRDTLYGGDGNDLLDASGGIVGTQGFGDFIRAGLGQDTILGHAAHWATGEGADISYADIGGVGGLTITSGVDGTGTVVSGDGRVNDTFTFIHYFQGSQDSDSITGAAEDRWEGFEGNAGNDTIDAGGGDARMDYGNEHFEGGSAGVTVNLGTGNQATATGTATDTFGDTDTLIRINQVRGSIFDDVLIASGRTDGVRLQGDEGNDSIVGGSGSDRLEGGDGNDSIRGANGNDVLLDGDGNDSLIGGAGNDVWEMGSGEDTFDGGGGFDTVRIDLSDATPQSFAVETNLLTGDSGAVGNPNLRDTLINVEAVELIGDFDITVTGSTVANLIVTDQGDDSLIGNAGDDTLTGGDGNDTLRGGNDDDVLDGGAGNDSILGGQGNDRIVNSGGGQDIFNGGDGEDTLFTDVTGLTPAEVLRFDLVAGTHGRDGTTLGQDALLNIEHFEMAGSWDAILVGNDVANSLTSASGNDTVTGGLGNDTLTTGGGDDVATGNQGADTLLGGDGNDRLDGGFGNDSVSGGTGDDTILGGGGFDTLRGGAGNDTINGGDGRDSVFMGG
ncbi:calcium-binding protein, partial [uncultured Tateyamaria sp.]|uniref:beta strand repeat-containing protein n=2 Tax=uncultured Tateyamaria sp. TaxID=455651 RepID=UPI002610B70E